MVYLVVGAAGVLGALLRFYTGQLIGGWLHTGVFPLATLLINWVGCLLLGWFLTRTGSYLSVHPWLKAGFGTGFIGAFTTFSTFSLETLKLLQDKHWLAALCYVLLSLWGGLFAAWSGEKLAHLLYAERDGKEALS